MISGDLLLCAVDVNVVGLRYMVVSMLVSWLRVMSSCVSVGLCGRLNTVFPLLTTMTVLRVLGVILRACRAVVSWCTVLVLDPSVWTRLLLGPKLLRLIVLLVGSVILVMTLPL